MKSPVANWHFVRWLAQRYDGGAPFLLCNDCCIHGHDSKRSDLAFLIININQDLKYTHPCLLAVHYGCWHARHWTTDVLVGLTHQDAKSYSSSIKDLMHQDANNYSSSNKDRVHQDANSCSSSSNKDLTLDLHGAGREPLPGYDPVAQRQEAASAIARRTSSGALPGKSFPLISHIAGYPYIGRCCLGSPMPNLCIKALSLLLFELSICCCTLASKHDLLCFHKCSPNCQDFANTCKVWNARCATTTRHSMVKWHQAWYRCMWAVGSSSGWSTPQRQFSGNSPWVSQSRGPPSTTFTRVSVPARRPPPLKREYSGSDAVRMVCCLHHYQICLPRASAALLHLYRVVDWLS